MPPVDPFPILETQLILVPNKARYLLINLVLILIDKHKSSEFLPQNLLK